MYDGVTILIMAWWHSVTCISECMSLKASYGMAMQQSQQQPANSRTVRVVAGRWLLTAVATSTATAGCHIHRPGRLPRLVATPAYASRPSAWHELSAVRQHGWWHMCALIATHLPPKPHAEEVRLAAMAQVPPKPPTRVPPAPPRASSVASSMKKLGLPLEPRP
jgi:hypothetical protein